MKIVFQQSLGLWSLGRIGVEAVPNKRVELGRPFLRFLETLRRFFLELKDSHVGLDVRVGNHSLGELNRSHSQRPNIGLVGILGYSSGLRDSSSRASRPAKRCLASVYMPRWRRRNRPAWLLLPC